LKDRLIPTRPNNLIVPMKFLRHLLLVLLIGNSIALNANHILGGDLTYECVGGDQYVFSLNLYVDCFGATAAPIEENLFFQPACGFLFSATADWQSTIEVSDLCATEIPNSSCNGGFIPGTWLVSYTTDPITLSDVCPWEITWAAGDWNYFVNMDNAGLPTAFFSTTIDLTNPQCGESVNFSNALHVPYVCMGDAISYDIDISNPSGYDLTFSFTDVLTTGGVPAPYEGGYSGATPIPGITIDPVTGQIDFTAPMQIGTFSVGVLVEMFDAGVFVGSVIESIAFVVRPCVVAPTVFDPDGILAISAGGNQISAVEAEVCVGDSICIEVHASNLDAFRTIELTSDFEALYPGATFTVTGTNPAVGELCMLADASYPATSLITIDALDDNCAPPGMDQLQITLHVRPSLITAFTDTLTCIGSFIDLDVQGDVLYDWNVISGDPIDVPANFSCLNCGDPTVSPAISTVYQVIGSNVPALCNQRDTITVNVALSAIDSIKVNESCAGMDGSIDFSVLVGSGNYSFDWSGPNGFSEITEDISGLEGGQYSVDITDLDIPACDATYEVFIDSTPPPSGMLNNDTTICAGQCIDLDFTLTGTGPFDLTMVGIANQIDVADGFTFNVCPAATTTYTLVSVTDANVPSCNTAINDDIVVTVRPTVTANFSPPANICAGEDMDLVLNIDQVGSYNVTYDDGTNVVNLVGAQDGDLINVSPALTTTYTVTSVSYQNAPNCANTTPTAVSLVVNPIPTAVLSGAASICAGQQATLSFELTGNGPFDVDWDDSVVTTNEVNIADGYTVNVSPAATTTYCITSIGDNSTPACSQLVNSCVDITVNPLPTAGLTQDATICNGSDVDLEFELNGTGPFDVEYTVSVGANVILNGIADGYLENVSPIVNTTYCIIGLTDSNTPQCSAVVNECVDITVNTLPTLDIDGSSNICEDQCVDIPLVITGAGPFNVEWEIELVSDGTITPQPDLVGVSNGDLHNVCASESIIVRATSISDNNNPTCTAIVDTEYTITVVEYSTVVLSGDSTICAGGDGELILTIEGMGGPYNIDLDDGLGNITNVVGVVPGDLNIDNEYVVLVNPAATSTYSVVLFTDASNSCVQFSGTATITVAPIPVAVFTADAQICPGDNVDLDLGLTGIGPFDITINDGTADDVVIGALDGDVYNVSPAVTTTYTLTSVTDMGSNAECEALPAIDVVVSLLVTPQATNIDTICDGTGEFYQIYFEITGGNSATYSVSETGVGAGVLNAVAPFDYLSDFIPSGQGASFDIQDGDGCGATTLTIDPYSCPVITDAGTMDPVAIDACESEVALGIWNNDETLDANDQVMFVLHTDATANLGQVLALDCDDPGFNDADTPLVFGNGVGEVEFETTYYISAVAGNDDGTGDCVDLNHVNISVAIGTPVVFHEEPEADLSGGEILCAGDSTLLSIDFTGIGPWTFTYAIDAVDQAPIVTALDPYTFYVQQNGDYTLTAVSNALCTGTTSGNALVSVNPLPTVLLGPDGEICAGDGYDLTLDLTGTPNWSIDLVQQDEFGLEVATTNYVAAATPFDINLTEEGDYYVTQITDGNGCVLEDDSPLVNLIVNVLPEALITMPDTSICEGQFVDIPIQLFGNGPWDVVLGLDAAPQPSVNEVNDTLIYTTNLPELVEILQITDANNCQGLAGASVQVTTIAIPLADAGPDVTICSNVDVVIGTAAVPGLSYSWTQPSTELSDDAIAQPTFNAENTTALPGVINLVLTVSEGNCFATDDVDVTVDPEPIANAGPDQTICYGETADLAASGGIACVWDPSPSLDDAAICNPTVTTLLTETFTVQIEGANGCFATDDVTITVPEELVLTITDSSPEVCFGLCDGFIDSEGAGGIEPYTITLTYPDLTTAIGVDFTDLCAGDYTVTLEDAVGCTVDELVQILELPEYVFDGVVDSGNVCFGESDASITLTSAQAVEYSIDGGVAELPNLPGGHVFDGLPAGDYDVTATDAVGCTVTENVIIGTFPQINFEVDEDAIVACYQVPVDLGAEALGGSGVFDYFWMTEAETAFDTGQQISFIPTDEIVLLSYAIDDNGCGSDTLSVEITFPPPFEATLTPSITQFICQGESITLSVEASGGNGFPAPEWIGIYANEIVSNQLSFTITPEDDELYEVTITDGCTQPLIDTVSVVVMDIPNVQIGYTGDNGCFPVEVQLINETESNMIASCEWSLGDGTILPACIDTVNYVYSTPGSYEVALTITSNQGCSATGTLAQDIEVYPYPVANFSWEPLPPNILENEIQFINQTSLGSTFEWDFGILGSSNLPNPTISLPLRDQGFYPVCLIATSIYGCTDTICQVVDMESILLLYVPTAFTPDGDGINDVFYPVVSGISQDDYTFRIFDRWGNLVFESNIIDEPWLGNYDGGEHYVQNDVFVWQMKCKLLDSGDNKEYFGRVTLVR